ncbi:hypothetical protein EE612_022459 [Oryza sativa]|nr:hypothetical protein EE612_022459 [Oryza sativa]
MHSSYPSIAIIRNNSLRICRRFCITFNFFCHTQSISNYVRFFNISLRRFSTSFGLFFCNRTFWRLLNSRRICIFNNRCILVNSSEPFSIDFGGESSSKLHLVIFPWLAFGHVLPYLELAERVASRGHRVSFVSTPRNIARLLPVSPAVAPRVDLVVLPLPHVDGLSVGAECTNDVPSDKFELLWKAFDALAPPFAEFLGAACVGTRALPAGGDVHEKAACPPRPSAAVARRRTPPHRRDGRRRHHAVAGRAAARFSGVRRAGERGAAARGAGARAGSQARARRDTFSLGAEKALWR